MREGHFEGLYYRLSGAGQPIIALHGFGATSFTWRHLTPLLERKHSIYLFDLKGHGKSETPTDSNYSLKHQADIILRFIRNNKLQDITLIGHSLGGGIAILIAILLINDKELRLSKIILLDTIAFPQRPPFFIWALTLPFVGRLLANIIPARLSVKSVLNFAYYDRSKVKDDAVIAYSWNFRDSTSIESMIRTARSIIPTEFKSIMERYHEINAPALILWGANDRVVSPCIGIMLNTQLENSTFSVIDQCGHIPHEEVPDITLARIFNFIERQRLSAGG